MLWFCGVFLATLGLVVSHGSVRDRAVDPTVRRPPNGSHQLQGNDTSQSLDTSQWLAHPLGLLLTQTYLPPNIDQGAFLGVRLVLTMSRCRSRCPSRRPSAALV